MKNHLKLCVKEITGSISASEKMQLENWLTESDANRKEYENLKIIWKSSRVNMQNSFSKNDLELLDMDTEWDNLQSRLNLGNNKNAVKGSVSNKRFQFIDGMFGNNLKPILGTAVAILILITSLLLWNRGDYTTKTKTVSTTNREHLRVDLPDGSIAELNSASSISFWETFTDSIREVRLKGEAFFSVSKSTKPFIVRTENARTKVLGTKFNVWARGEITRVIVKEGRVNLIPNDGRANGVTLSQNQISSVTKNQQPTSPEHINADMLLGWLSGKLVFVQTPLGEIIGEIERYYDVRISLTNDEMKDYTVTGSFNNTDADSVIAMICLTLNLDHKKVNNGYLIETKN